MTYLLDTDTFSALVNHHAKVAQVVSKHDPADLKLSVITHGEVLYGLAFNLVGPRKLGRVQFYLNAFDVLPLTASVSARYASLRAHLSKLGTPIGPNDHWLAAHALSEGLTMVTSNMREFKRVPGLKVENWL